jgi:hypothetical protein
MTSRSVLKFAAKSGAAVLVVASLGACVIAPARHAGYGPEVYSGPVVVAPAPVVVAPPVVVVRPAVRYGYGYGRYGYPYYHRR